MFKSFLFGLLAGVILTGLGWYFAGRNNLSEIRQDLNRVHGDFEGVQRNSNQLSINSDGFAGDITIITDTSRRIEDRSKRIAEGLSDADGDLGLSIDKVDKLEQFNKRLIRIGRDVGSLAYELRRISEESREKE